MKIAQIAPIIERVPPKTYGGTERVVYNLTENLVKLGHDVTLFASGDSKTSAKLVSVVPKGLREIKINDLYGPNQWTLLNIGLAYDHQKEFDIIHDHNSYISLPVANISKTPAVLTVHGAITRANKHMFEILTNPYLVSISKAQTQAMSNLNFIGTVHNGLDMYHYPYSEKQDGYLLYVGRFSLEKGVHFAIDVAEALNLPLKLAAKLDEKDRYYFDRYIKPRLNNPLIEWVGEVNEVQRNELMSRALCFLHPATWREPFGLTLIEAMACGCPVVAFNKGSISEIIKSGITGFAVSNAEEMIRAVRKINTIPRAKCRIHALTNFNGRKMALEYESIYYQILNERLLLGDLAIEKSLFGLVEKPNYVAAHDVKKVKKR